MKKRVVIFASGSGSNALNTCSFFENSDSIEVVALYCNNSQAGVIQKISTFGIPVVLFNKEQWKNESQFLAGLNQFQPDLIVLLGFLWKVPKYLVDSFTQKIVNLHPALLPKYGGKGMFGMHVHEAVLANGEKETGITIHWVNEQYDEGAIIKQFRTYILPSDTAIDIANKIHDLEQKFVPITLQEILIKDK